MAVDVSDSAATPAQGDSKEAIVERAKQASVYIESQYPTVVCIFVPALILDCTLLPSNPITRGKKYFMTASKQR